VRDLLDLLRVAAENRRYLRALHQEEQRQLGQRSWYRALDRGLRDAYRWSDPFSLSRRAKRRLALPKADLVYGETPLLTAWHMLSRLGVDQVDHVVELGAGRATFSLVAVSAFGCRASALEVVPAFVQKTRELAARLGLDGLQARTADILATPLPQGSVYFLTPTTFTDDSWRQLSQRLREAPEGARAISLSVPLPEPHWKLEERTSLPFSWGENNVFFQVRQARDDGAAASFVRA
jgi:hypothetical protein